MGQVFDIGSCLLESDYYITSTRTVMLTICRSLNKIIPYLRACQTCDIAWLGTDVVYDWSLEPRNHEMGALSIDCVLYASDARKLFEIITINTLTARYPPSTLNKDALIPHPRIEIPTRAPKLILNNLSLETRFRLYLVNV
jgi:hypothetical protein